MYLQHNYVFSIKEFFTVSFFFKTNSQSLSFFKEMNVEMKKFSCTLSCTWMTIIDCLFYASDRLS